MKIVAITDFHFGIGRAAEVLRFGDEFTPPGTGPMNAAEHAASLIRQGVACAVADYPKIRAQREAGYLWGRAQWEGKR